MIIYHITSRKAWIDATRNGAYAAPSLEIEGFIHCSTAVQVLPVARNFFAGQTGLVLLVIDSRRLQAEVKWESAAPPDGVAEGVTFPHIYGPIPLDAVVQVLDLEPDSRGEFVMPPLPSENGLAAALETRPHGRLHRLVRHHHAAWLAGLPAGLPLVPRPGGSRLHAGTRGWPPAVGLCVLAVHHAGAVVQQPGRHPFRPAAADRPQRMGGVAAARGERERRTAAGSPRCVSGCGTTSAWW